MPTDAYVRFGEDQGSENDDYGQPQPLIMGDCTDAKHLNWCELRDTDFQVEFPHNDEKEGSDSEKAPSQRLPTITLKKRVDWASTRLILACIQASQASVDKNKENDGVIEKVMVEVCKDAGQDDEEGKLCFLAFEYRNVRILDYSVDMSDPEPSETIRFAYDVFRMGYQKTDPETGESLGSMEWTSDIADTTGSDSVSETANSSQSVAALPAMLGAQGAAQTSAAASANGNGAAAGALSTATDAAAAANFPGVWGPAGLGVLPD